MRRGILTFFFLIAICLPVSTHATGELNAGFVQGLWYSSNPILANEPVRIYVALRNNTDRDLSGTVRFEANGRRIGTASINALPGRLVEAWSDWTPEYGSYTVTATLTDIKLHTIGEGAEKVTISNTLAEDIVFVDYDTDEDGIPNEEDLDDDNDSLSDIDEIEAGTDPLVFTKSSRNTTKTTETNGGAEEQTETEDKTASKTSTGSGAKPEGLEKYLGESRIDSVLSGVTEKIIETKDSLDTYREKRGEALENNKASRELTELSKSSISTTTSNTGETATITRTQTEAKPGIFASIFSGIGAILRGTYTLILYLLSGILGHPVIVQLLLLLGILYGTYKLAKKLGGRPQ